MLDERHVAEFTARGLGGLLWRGAAVLKIARGHFEVRGDFLFERVLFFVVAIVLWVHRVLLERGEKLLFMAQRLHRIDLHGAARRDVTGGERDGS